MKMNWRNRLSLCLLPLALVLFFVLKNSPQEKTQKIQARKIASTPISKLKKPLPPKAIQALKKKSLRHEDLRNRIPQSEEETFQKDGSIKLSKGYEFLKDVGAVSIKDFQSEMGEVIQRTDHLVYFRAGSGHPYIPVAISRHTNILAPISSIVHVKNISPVLRSTLLAEGYEQYYYHKHLKFLSLKGQSGKVLDLYTDLVQKGYEAQLEVLKPGPHAH